MKIIFMGTAELSRAILERLVREPQMQIGAVVTQPDKPKGRELKPQPPPVKKLAQKLNLPVLQPPKARDEHFISTLREIKPELIVVAAYGHILPPAILDLPRFGCLNVHTSLLPKYRGAAPIQWAIANGETETGVTIMKMDAGMDTGGILAQRRTPIMSWDDSVSLHDRLARLGAELLVETVADYVSGKIAPAPQPEGGSNAPKIKKKDGRMDWKLPAQSIVNRLRAFTPWPGAFTFLPDQPKRHLLKIWKAEVVEADARGTPREPEGATRACPGEILSVDENGMVIACGQGALRILELQREGGRRMTAREFLAGHALTAGNTLD